MKRSEINQALADSLRCFKASHRALPPQPRWDVTDFGLSKFAEISLVLVNLAEQQEYCECSACFNKAQD
jgi:D-lyxose ketol-isomerase